jgi:exodeoxyribonuclease VII small subunit
MAKQKKEISFEDKIQKIEEIIDRLNNENLPLQEAINLHTEASALIKDAEEFLQKTSLQFESLNP